jgi:hypothetical protein
MAAAADVRGERAVEGYPGEYSWMRRMLGKNFHYMNMAAQIAATEFMYTDRILLKRDPPPVFRRQSVFTRSDPARALRRLFLCDIGPVGAFGAEHDATATVTETNADELVNTSVNADELILLPRVSERRDTGVSTYARVDIKDGRVLGVYTGELTHQPEPTVIASAEDAELSRYAVEKTFGAPTDEGDIKNLGVIRIDARRAGNILRFCDKACATAAPGKPGSQNARFSAVMCRADYMGVPAYVPFFIMTAMRPIGAGERVLPAAYTSPYYRNKPCAYCKQWCYLPSERQIGGGGEAAYADTAADRAADAAEAAAAAAAAADALDTK